MKEGIIYKDLSYQVTGACFFVHNQFGRYLREKQYGDLLEEALTLRNISFKREVSDNFGNRLDFLVDDKIIIELKVKPIIEKKDYFQAQRYLQMFDKKLCLLVNFSNRYVKPIRVIKIDKLR